MCLYKYRMILLMLAKMPIVSLLFPLSDYGGMVFLKLASGRGWHTIKCDIRYMEFKCLLNIDLCTNDTLLFPLISVIVLIKVISPTQLCKTRNDHPPPPISNKVCNKIYLNFYFKIHVTHQASYLIFNLFYGMQLAHMCSNIWYWGLSETYKNKTAAFNVFVQVGWPFPYWQKCL